MSTVLRPVGPLPPQTYWLRRGIVVGLPLLLILIVAVSCSGGGGSPSGNGHTPSPSVTRTTAPPQPCTNSEVQLKLTADKAQYTIGETPKFTGTFTNVGEVACTLTLSQADEAWTVTSGQTKIWSTKGCAPSSATTATPTVRTIEPGSTRTRSITWAGKQYDKCQPAGDLQNGEYVLRATLDGITASAGTVFQMTAAGGG